MDITPIQFLIICPLVFLAGFIDAIAGGGGLISLPAYLISGMPVHYAIATNKCSASMGTVIATWKYAKKGYVKWKLVAFAVFGAFAGSNIGARLALMLDDGVFKIVMLFLIPMTAVYVLRGKSLVTDKEPYSFGISAMLCTLVAFIIGIYDGFYGPGTGTFLLLFLTGLVHIGLTEANGTTKVINLCTNLTSLSVFLLNGKVVFSLGLTAGLFSIAGNYLGARQFEKGGAKSVRPVMIIVLVIFFVKVLWEVLPFTV